MGRCAHRPGGLWFCDLRVRLTKPPQIAEECGLGVRAVRGGHSGCGHPAPAAIGAGFVRLAAGCSRVRPAGIRGRKRRDGSSVRPLCGRKRSRPAETPALKGRWAGMPIDPAVHGSPTCGFALRNLHKSPNCWVGASPRLQRLAGFGCLSLAAISAGFVRLVAGRARSTCGRPRVYVLRASGAVHLADARARASGSRGGAQNTGGGPDGRFFRRNVARISTYAACLKT